MPRPICVCCGKLCGSRWITEQRFKVEIGQPIPPYDGNLCVMKERFDPEMPPKGPAHPDEATSYTPMDDAPQRGNYTGRKGRTVRRLLWDQETWIAPYAPFCTLRCALDFAKASYAAGFRVPGNP